jgi:biopolymer transport protein ExbD
MKVSSRHLGIKKPRIEMLPLIDIVFLLLVFFIYAMLSMAVHRSLPVSLPVSSTAEIHTEFNLTVSVNSRGEIYVDSINVSLVELQDVLQGKIRLTGDAASIQVDLFAGRALSYQELYRVLDIIRSSGVSNVSLQAGSSK